MKSLRALLALSPLLGLVACATPVSAPQAGFDQVRSIQAADLPPMKVGAFVPGQAVSRSADSSLMVRAGVLNAPGGSFAKYLGDTVAADLKAAGRYDAGSSLEISGLLTETHVGSMGPHGHARLAADFTLAREGKAVFGKRVEASSEWSSDFVGAVAIPEAMNHYLGLYQQLVGQLLADKDFRQAAKVRKLK